MLHRKWTLACILCTHQKSYKLDKGIMLIFVFEKKSAITFGEGCMLSLLRQYYKHVGVLYQRCVCWSPGAYICAKPFYFYIRSDSRFAPSHWGTALLGKDVSHWLGASLESVLYIKTREISLDLLKQFEWRYGNLRKSFVVLSDTEIKWIKKSN